MSGGGLLKVVVTEELWGAEEKRVFSSLWKSPAPLKVVAFTWKVLLNWVPIKANLALRNVHGPEEPTLCMMCNVVVESSNHLFLHCIFASSVWSSLMTLLDYYFLIPPNLFVHWECWSGRAGNKNRLRGLWMIWLTTIWVVWNARNDKIFKGINHEVEQIVEEVKFLSWRWVLKRMNISVCLYYEWCWNPIICHERVRMRV